MKWFVFIYRSLIVTIASIAWWEGLIKRNANARNFCVSYSSDCAFYRPTRNESLKAFIVSGVRWSVKLSQQTEAQKLHFCVRQWSLLTILRGCLYGNWKPSFLPGEHLTGVHFRGKLQHGGDVSEWKIKSWPIRTREICGVSLSDVLYVNFSKTRADRHNGILMSLLLLVAEKISTQVA